jgi:hypothetical protein
MNENEKLKRQIADLEVFLSEANEKVKSLETEAANAAQKARIFQEGWRESESKLEASKKEAALTEDWLVSRIDEELVRAGLSALQWTDGGGSKCPTGWHRNPYINSDLVILLKKELLDLMETTFESDWGPNPVVCRWCKCWLRYNDLSKGTPVEAHNKNCFAARCLGRPSEKD